MRKKTLILSKQQINEIIGEEWNVNVDTNTDTKENNGANETFASDHMEDTYSTSQTITNNISHDLTCDLYGPWRKNGINGAVYTLREWKKKINEDVQDYGKGNGIVTFSDAQKKKFYEDKPEECNSVNVGEKLANGQEKEGNMFAVFSTFLNAKEEGNLTGDFTRYNKMGGDAGFNLAKKYREKLMAKQKNIDNANGNHIKSASKTSGNGKAHS